MPTGLLGDAAERCCAAEMRRPCRQDQCQRRESIMEKNSKGRGFGGETTSYEHIPRLTVERPPGLKRHLSPSLALQRKVSRSGDVLQDRGPLPEYGPERSRRYLGEACRQSLSENALPAEIQFPLCDAAVRKMMAATGISLMPLRHSVLRPATTALGRVVRTHEGDARRDSQKPRRRTILRAIFEDQGGSHPPFQPAAGDRVLLRLTPIWKPARPMCSTS